MGAKLRSLKPYKKRIPKVNAGFIEAENQWIF